MNLSILRCLQSGKRPPKIDLWMHEQVLTFAKLIIGSRAGSSD